MGDRANVVIPQEGKDVNLFLYTHWSGSELPQTVQRALRRKERWNDPQYLARIIFSEMIREDLDSATGHGISAGLKLDGNTDGLNRLLYVDVAKQEVRLQLGNYDGEPQGPPLAYSFRAYIEATFQPRWPGSDD